MLSILIEIWIWRHLHLHAGSVWGGINIGTMDSASTSVQEKAVPTALALKPDHSLSPHTFLVLSELLPQNWSPELVNPLASKSKRGPFKRNACNSRSLLSHLARISGFSQLDAGFSQLEVEGTSLPSNGIWAGEPILGPGCLTLLAGEGSCSQDDSPNF